MTLLQRDREHIELGREEGREEGRKEGHKEGAIFAAKIIKMHHKGIGNAAIAASLQLSLEYVSSVISDYEND